MKKTILTLSLALTVSMAGFAAKDNPKGELKAIYSENFNALTAGEESAPATEELSQNGKVDPELTGGLQWSGRGLHQAAGALAVMQFEQSDWFGTELVQGYVRTPYYDVRMDEGNFTVRFRARVLDAESADLLIELYDPYVTNNIDYASLELTDQWAVYEVDLCHPGYGNHHAFLEMASTDHNWLIDDVEIIQDYFQLLPPVVHYPRNVTYEQFTGRWNEVPLADSYLVSVFSLDADGNRVDLHKDIPTAECSLTVEGTVKGTDYYYAVRTVNEQFMSEESEPTRVYVSLSELDKPVTFEAENVTTDGFTARWEPTFRAMGYVIGLSKHFVATDDGLSTIVSEDFDKITDGDFSWPYPFYGNLDDITSMPGWDYNYFTVRVVSGMFGLENTYKKYGEEVFLATPSLDLTGDGGRFTVAMDVYGDKDDVVSLTCGDVTLTHKLEKQGSQSFTLEFDNGSASSVIRIEFDGDGYLFIDNIAVQQQIHVGDIVKENVGNYRTDTPDTYFEFTGLNANEGDTFIYTVTAWSYSQDEDGVWGPDIFSEISEPRSVVIADPAGLTDIDSAVTKVTVDGAALHIAVPAAAVTEVFNLNGVMIGRYPLAAGDNVIELANRGVVIVRVAAKAFRVIL